MATMKFQSRTLCIVKRADVEVRHQMKFFCLCPRCMAGARYDRLRPSMSYHTSEVCLTLWRDRVNLFSYSYLINGPEDTTFFVVWQANCEACCVDKCDIAAMHTIGCQLTWWSRNFVCSNSECGFVQCHQLAFAGPTHLSCIQQPTRSKVKSD